MSNFSFDGDYFFPSILFKQDHNHPNDGPVWNPASGFERTSTGFRPSNDIRCLRGGCDINIAKDIEKNNQNIKLRVYINQLKKYMNYDSKTTNFE
ncbi:hypothetical protein ACN9MN_15355 [Chryseobacterium sp. S-02]|uniref:hypothetical protein n=1 Tax=Chryseobacterium sp. S-02 TaxID=3404064 RepID=UPI003CEE3818